nr:disease resistance protein (TIR-NBS-LRR class) family [Tanacetum cinerariifolium]
MRRIKEAARRLVVIREVRGNAILLNLEFLQAVAMQESIFILNFNIDGSEALLASGIFVSFVKTTINDSQACASSAKITSTYPNMCIVKHGSIWSTSAGMATRRNPLEKNITSFSDVSEIPNLEWLDVSLCSDLMEIHQSVMLHERIFHLDIGGCHTLEILPPCRLSVLDISGCNMMGETTIINQIFDWPYHLDRNNIVNNDFLRDMYNAWPSLEELCLSFNLMIRIPASISHLSHVKYLDLRNCNKLKELPKLPSLIQVLKADHCEI